MTGRPSEEKLLAVEWELRKLKPGTQRAVGGGIYMRLDRSGRRRFQFRSRDGGGQPAGTYDSWEETHAARSGHELLAEVKSGDGGESSADGEPTVAQMLGWEIERYAWDAWWPHVLLDCDQLTQLDYRRGLADLLPHLRGVTMGQWLRSPLLLDRLRTKIAAAKTYPDREGEKPRLHRAAADKPLKILRILGGHATGKGVLPYNPAARVAIFNRRRSAAGDRDAPSHRPILPSEVKHILVVAPYNEQVGLLNDVLGDHVRIGTVDKFQGQQAAVVFFSMATSSGAEVPCNLEFLFSRNRLNVAVSRARCLAYVVATPRLLEVGCRSIGPDAACQRPVPLRRGGRDADAQNNRVVACWRGLHRGNALCRLHRARP